MKHALSIIFIVFLSGCSSNSSNKISLPLKDAKWDILNGNYEKKPISIRINRTLENHIGSLKYEAAASVAIKKPLANGMPDSIELYDLNKMVNIMIEKLDKTGLAVYALEVITDKTCDCIFYTDNKKAVKNILSEIALNFKDYQIASAVKSDEMWMNYKWFSSYATTGYWGGL